MSINQAVILVGGKGTRLKNLTKNTPKPLLEISKKPFIEHVIWNLSRHGIKDVLLFAGYLGNQFKDKYHNTRLYNSKIQVIIENEPLGTGGLLLNSLIF